jgi:type I restriction enzyme M protein
MANPPFMSPKGGIRPHKRFSIQANRSEVLFVDYIAEHLNPGGRAGIIVPEGIIFQSGNAYKALRKMLVDNYLFCVVSLPAGVFNPYSGVKTSILLMDKTLAKQTDKILFLKIENDGFDLGAQRREIPGSDFPQALINIKNYLQSVRNGKEFCLPDPPNILLVSKQQLAETGDYNLSMERYRAEVTSSANWPMVELKAVLERNSETVSPLDIDGEINYIGLENISSDTGKLEGDIVSLAQDIKSTKIRFEPHNLLYGKLRPNLNKVWLSDRRGICSTDIFVLVARNKNVDIRFYNYVLRSTIFNGNVLNGLNGAQLPRVDWGYFSNIKIPLPPLSLQQEIVTEIESYQKIIDGARQVVENYKPQIKIDPSWPLVELGEICKPQYGFTTTGKDHGDARLIRITDIGSDGRLIPNDAKYLILDSESKAYLLKKGDILVARTGATFGKTMLFKADYPSVFASFLIRLNFIKPDSILPEYYWSFSQSDEYWKQAKQLMTGGGQPQFNGNALIKIKIPLPDVNIQREIVAQIEKEQQLVDANKQLIQIYEQKIKDKIAEVWET